MDNCSPSFTFGKQLIRHNLVVFRNGELALQVLPALIDLIPEARLNLAIYQLRQKNVSAALKLLDSLQPSAPHEYVLKAVVSAVYGQSLSSTNRLAAAEHLKLAQQYFQLVGSSASECGEFELPAVVFVILTN
jgi:intraflagellar transport protein 56